MVICPKCRSERTAPVMYGYPTYEAFELSEQGKLILGGCNRIDGMPEPDYGCLDCGYKWAIETLPATKITKIRYKTTENGPCALDMQKIWIYDIFPVGKCVRYCYHGKIRFYQYREDKNVSEGKVYRLACELQKIIGAPLWEKQIIEGEVCDGYSYNLQITYADKRKKTMIGDVAGGTFDSIMEKFVHSIF